MATARSWRIASFNVFNLNEPGLPMYRNREGWSEAAYQAKLDWGAQLLQRLQADVVGVQELWHRRSLERMVRRFTVRHTTNSMKQMPDCAPRTRNCKRW